MAKQSSKAIASPCSATVQRTERQIAFELTRPLDDLEEMLLVEFAGRTMTMQQVFASHHVGRPFLSRNYKAVLKKLEEEGKITASPPAAKRKANTFADSVQVTFPPR